MSMNDKPLVQKKIFSLFFYKSKLYEFSQKKLFKTDHLAMKQMSEKISEAKYEIGGVLLSLEYLSKLNEVSLEIKNKDHNSLERKSSLYKTSIVLFFIVLTIIFSVSGYYIVSIFFQGDLN